MKYLRDEFRQKKEDMCKISIPRSDGSSIGMDFEIPLYCEDNDRALENAEKRFSKRFSKCAYWGFFKSKRKGSRNNNNNIKR